MSSRKDTTVAELDRLVEELREANARLVIAGVQLQELAEAAERARLDAERSRSEAEAANHAKDEFIAAVSHELRTPLNAIMGWVHLLRQATISPETQRHGLEVIDRNVTMLARQLADLLEVSAILAGKLKLELHPVDLSSLVESSLDTLRPAAIAKNITLTSDVDPVRPILGEPARLQQILWNLLSNAIKFTPPRGSVQVVLQPRGSMAEIRVVDSGIGIEPVFLPHVFDRFRQETPSAQEKGGGLGLGLAIVKQLVEVQGGTVRVESPGKGRGATFVVAFPTIHGASDLPPDEESISTASLAGLRLLVVEDNDDSRDVLVTILEAHGANVVATSCAEEGLRLVNDVHPDLIVADIGLPGEDGYTFIRRVRARENNSEIHVPALALTAFATSDDRHRAVDAGYDMHFAKGDDPRQLIAAIVALTNAPQPPVQG